ncbi:uncharacterized protein [Hyperolius riggenbachi]|uniref:uncharacterized protein isoform X1 n=1 Tax=Hyperolius riggenbachi TaxID=752182 RepID=UPI0035A36657
MKIAILFTLIGLSLCQEGESQSNPKMSCPQDGCLERIRQLSNEDLRKLADSKLCDAKSRDDVIQGTVEYLQCMQCEAGGSRALMHALSSKIQQAELGETKCSKRELLNKLNGPPSRRFFSGGDFFGGGPSGGAFGPGGGAFGPGGGAFGPGGGGGFGPGGGAFGPGGGGGFGPGGGAFGPGGGGGFGGGPFGGSFGGSSGGGGLGVFESLLQSFGMGRK